MQYFPVKFDFLNNDKSYNRDFSTIYTIDDGLSFDGIESMLSWDNVCLIPYAMFR